MVRKEPLKIKLAGGFAICSRREADTPVDSKSSKHIDSASKLCAEKVLKSKSSPPVSKFYKIMATRASCDIGVYLSYFIISFTMFVLTVARDVKPQQEKYLPDYTVYHNLSRIQSHLVEIVNKNPDYMSIDYIYKSRENLPQMLLRVTNFTDTRMHTATDQSDIGSTPKVKVLLSFGEHAREFLPIESLFHLLLNITQGLNAPKHSFAESFSRTVLAKLDLFIVAVMNPDGRRFLENSGNYCWRGTSTGVDLNRNFDWHFGHEGSSAKKDDEEYRGTHVFSEPECVVLVDLTSKYKFDAFVSLHSGIRQIYVPFADSLSKRSHRKPENIELMLELADKMSHASVQIYTYGLAYQLNEYTADGTIFDYMAGTRKIPFSFAIELWGAGDYKGAKCFDLFNPVNSRLQAAVEEIHPIYSALFLYLIEWKQNQMTSMYDPSLDAPSLNFGYMLLGVVILLTLVVAIHSRLPPCLRLYNRRRVVSLRSLSSTFSSMTFLRS